MKIVDSGVLMSAHWAASRQHSTKETVQFWNQKQNISTEEKVIVEISEEGKSLFANQLVSPADSANEEIELHLSEKDKEKIRLLEDFIYVLTGKRLRFLVPKKLKFNGDKPAKFNSSDQRPANRSQNGWGLRIDYNEYTRETQRLSFSSCGSVTTEDGRQINFALNFNVSREFVEYKSLSIRAGDALLDPLVINFKNASASLGDRNYSFDIDCDGHDDIIAFTGEGSGFLVLDLNNNNVVDDGSELFGPQTGNGFGELSAYDGDNNGWIDENDEIFNRLRIWTLDENGDKVLIALVQAGVGAIYLGNVQSEFSLKTPTNNTLGQIRQTGIFLKETGEAGTIQHVDLAI